MSISLINTFMGDFDLIWEAYSTDVELQDILYHISEGEYVDISNDIFKSLEISKVTYDNEEYNALKEIVITSNMRGTGIFKQVLQAFEKSYPNLMLYDVINSKLRQYGEENGYSSEYVIDDEGDKILIMVKSNGS